MFEGLAQGTTKILVFHNKSNIPDFYDSLLKH